MNNQQKQAMRWWHLNLSSYLSSQEKALSNDALQEVFALRRKLELTLVTDIATQSAAINEWLDSLERIYVALDTFSIGLSIVHCTEDIALSVSTLIQQWHSKNLEVDVRFTIIGQQVSSSCSLNRVAIHALYELLRLSTNMYHVKTLEVQLTTRDSHPSRLVVQVNRLESYFLRNLTSAIKSPDIRHLETAFTVLTGGLCKTQQTALGCNWSFEWETK